MQQYQLPEYTEEIQLPRIKQEQFLSAVAAAVNALRWVPVAINNNAITCHTPDTHFAPGEIVTITLQHPSVFFHSIPINEYYYDEQQNNANLTLFKQAIEEVIKEQEKADRNLHPMHREKYGALIPSKSYLVTPVLVYINVLLFLAMVVAGLSPLNPTAQSLYQWGGNFRYAVVSGDWWRLFTYMFLHGGAVHLLGNTFALLHIGMFLEPLLGKFRTAAAYLLTGVCAGLLSIAMHGNSVGVGASGAIFGLYGVFLAMLSTNHIQKTMRKTMLRSILFFVVFNLMMGLQGNTDNAAHIGGLLSGMAIGFAYFPGIAHKASIAKQVAVTAMLSICVVLLIIMSVSFFS